MDRAPRHIRRLSHARALFAPLAGARTETAGVAYLADGGRVIALRFIAGGVDHVTVPPRTLWTGSPARQRRALNEREVAFLAESAAHYVALKNDYAT